MRITESQLRKIIREEADHLTESRESEVDPRTREKFADIMQDVLSLIQENGEVYEAHMAPTGNRIVITFFNWDGTGEKPGAYLDFSLFPGGDTP